MNNNKKLNIVIIDYKMGNVKSITNAFKHICDHNIVVSSDPDDIRNSDALILPGVGAFGDAMEHLRERNLIELLNAEVLEKKKTILGICLGMQLLLNSSQEGGLYDGLGWIEGTVERIDAGSEYRIPHVGWNDINIKMDSLFFEGLGSDKNFYFVHSYYAKCPEKYIAATFEYDKTFTAAVQKNNILGMQFHPEKSQKNGFILLKNFIAYLERNIEC